MLVQEFIVFLLNGSHCDNISSLNSNTKNGKLALSFSKVHYNPHLITPMLFCIGTWPLHTGVWPLHNGADLCASEYDLCACWGAPSRPLQPPPSAAGLQHALVPVRRPDQPPPRLLPPRSLQQHHPVPVWRWARTGATWWHTGQLSDSISDT